MDFDWDFLARCLDNDDFPGLRGLIESLKKDPAAAEILERLAHDRHAEVRSWAAAVAEKTIGRAALPWLVEMARSDRDFDNRSMALQVILDIDVEAVRPLIPRLRSQVWHKETDYALDAARALTFIGDRDALPAMRALAESWDPNIYYRKMLGTYVLALDGQADVILERIRSHDHICVGWLAYAASAFIRTPEARAVLEWGAENLPDDQCRRDCARFLREGRWLPPVDG